MNAFQVKLTVPAHESSDSLRVTRDFMVKLYDSLKVVDNHKE